MDTFQAVFCMTKDKRAQQKYYGPLELLEKIKTFINVIFPLEEQKKYVQIGDEPSNLPLAIVAGYLILKRVTTYMRSLK